MSPRAAGQENEALLRFFESPEDEQYPLPVFDDLDRLACDIADALPRSSERTIVLRKLLEAKDAMWRAFEFEEPEGVERGAFDERGKP